jgi:hypothetical protein
MADHKNPFTLYERNGMVREVGFEPTNPYGTGASGLRVQDPTSSTGLFDLAWQHEPPHNQGGLPQTPGHAPAIRPPRQGPNWLSPFKESNKTGQCLIEPRREPHPNPTYPNHPGKMISWPPGAEKHGVYEGAGATAGDDPDNTGTVECREDMVTRDGNATDGAPSYATAGRSEQQALCRSARNTGEPST